MDTYNKIILQGEPSNNTRVESPDKRRINLKKAMWGKPMRRWQVDKTGVLIDWISVEERGKARAREILE